MSHELMNSINDLIKARENVERVKMTYKNNQVLFDFYYPSAQQLVQKLEEHVSHLLKEMTGSEFHSPIPEEEVDVWVRLEGDDFQGGVGPINIIGPYLRKLNTATRHAVALAASKVRDMAGVNIPSFSSLSLSATREGSLRLGLKHSPKTDQEKDGHNQLDLFNDQESDDSFDKLERKRTINKLSVDGFNLLLKTLASVDDDNALQDIKKDYNVKDVIKLIHYAKDLAPSSRSNIQCISFEVNSPRRAEKKVIKTGQETRKYLTEKAKKLKNDTEFVEGTGIIRALDLDHKVLIARPFKYNSETLDQIELKYDDTFDNANEYIEQFVWVSGFLIFNANNDPLRLDVDTISIKDEMDDDLFL